MEKTQANDYWKTAIKYFCLTILGLASIFCEILLIIPVLSPKTAIKMYKNFGLSAAAVGVGERQYNKTNKIEDLYNLVVLCDQVQNAEKLLEYSGKLLSREDFYSFEKGFNKYALEHADKDKLYLVASLENYLYEIRIEYEYKKSSEKAFLNAVSCFELEDVNLFYFEKYVDCVLGQSNVSANTKKQQISQVADALVGTKTVLKLVQERYNRIKVDIADATLLRLEQMWQTKRVEVVLLEAKGSSQLESAQTELLNLSAQIEARINND